jgi:sugar lactone lactonase YvrE
MPRLPATAALRDPDLDEAALARRIEAVGTKPLNDGLSTDAGGNIFITDVEHEAVLKMTADGKLETLIKDPRVRWADGLSFGPNGWLYLADSAIPHLALRSAAHIASERPYYIWRFKPGTAAPAGQ